jgi:hypothetical protein
MADLSEAARLRRLFEDMTGQSLEGVDLDEMRRVLREPGLPVDEPTEVAELERRWQELQPAILQAAVDPEVDAFLVVDPVFQAAMDRLGPLAIDPHALANEPAGVRAIVATRMVDGLVEMGGWVSVFIESQADMLPVAIDGYRLLGLDQHASLATRALRRGFVPPGPGDDEPDDSAEFAFWEDLEAAWFELPSPEAARAAYIGAHPDIG